MPIDHKTSSSLFFQREQYKKGGIGRWFWDFRDGQILKYIDEKDKNILDIGCGEGITLEKLIREYPDKNIAGIDVVSENVGICKQYDLPVSPGSVYNLQISGNSLDVCILSEVIEHLEDASLAIQNIKRILKPGGRLIIVFPNDLMFKLSRIFFLKFKEAFADLGHINSFSPRKIRKLLDSNGFNVAKIKNLPFFFWFISLNCLVIAIKK